MKPTEITTIEKAIKNLNLLYKRNARNLTIKIPFVKPGYSTSSCLHIPTNINMFKIQLKITNLALLAGIPTTLPKGGNWIRLTNLPLVPISSGIETEIINAYKVIQRMGVAF